MATENKGNHRVKEIREQLGFTHSAFAIELNELGLTEITSRKIKDIEEGRATLSAEIAVGIVKRFGSSLEWLYGRVEGLSKPIKNKSNTSLDENFFDMGIVRERITKLIEGNYVSTEEKYIGKNTQIIQTNDIDIARKSKKLTKEEFAEIAKLGKSTINENMQEKISINTAMLIADAFNVSLDWIFGLSDGTIDETIVKKIYDLINDNLANENVT
jgi:transcriptional regulator with XRE-family HTH domain